MNEFWNLTAQWLPMFWLILAIVLGVIEAVSFQFVAIWFALGAVVAIIPSLLAAPMWLQFVVFLAVSVLSLVATRPFVKKFLTTRKVKTNADSLIGKIGIVVEPVSLAEAKGRVMVSGQSWWAMSEDGSFLEKEERVLIKAIEGVKLVVERLR